MYKFLYTEHLNEKTTEFETKSLLYLLSMREDSQEINTFIIDCFNDVTGATENCDKLWDVQSKGIKTLRPLTIGESLITLFENYLSSLNFDYYILFFPKLNDVYFLDNNINVFNIYNFKDKFISKIVEGLKNEYIKRNKSPIEEKTIMIFLKEVNFVIDKDSKSEYIKNIINFKRNFGKNNDFFDSIFDEIRDKQSVLKNISIHHKEIEKASEVLQYNKYLKKNDIEMLIINRIIGVDIFKNIGIPLEFFQIIKNYDLDLQKDIINKCNSEISLMIFNNNDKEIFWSFFEKIYLLLKQKHIYTLDDIFKEIKEEKIIKKKILSEISAKYFIVLMKEGVENENT